MTDDNIVKFKKKEIKQLPKPELKLLFVITSEPTTILMELQKIAVRLTPKETLVLAAMLLAAAKETLNKDK